MADPQWSQQQLAIFDKFKNGAPDENVDIEALAGTGKTTTVVKAGDYAPEERIVYCAFNKRIEQELKTRLTNPRAESVTLHSLGFRSVRMYLDKVFLEKDSGDRANGITNAICGVRVPDYIKRQITKLHTKAREINPHARNEGELLDLAYKFECVPDNGWVNSGFDVNFVEKKSLECLEYAATQPPTATGIDFSDMIFLPVRNGWMVPTYDLVVVDEKQDMTPAQLEIARGSCKGRVIMVGDRHQAIYGFRGADVSSVDILSRELKATRMGLTVTYRCGRKIVELAQQFVPEYEAGPGNPEGEIQDLRYDKLVATATGGDFILSRMNAPLVSVAMALIRSQKRARIAGRDIGRGLTNIVRGLKAQSVPDALRKLSAWEERQVLRFTAAKREAQIELVKDQAETIRVLMEDAKGLDDVLGRIEMLFTDDGLGQKGVITCSSIHRSKGLEANRVFILRWTLKDYNQEELNIQYVAITRAIETLVWVDKAGE